MTDRLVFAGPASREFAKTLAQRLNLPILSVEVKEFSDTETKYRFEENVSGTSVLLVQSTYPPVDKNYMQIFLAAHHLSQEGAKVHAVIPYLGYARQDKQFLNGEVVSLGVVSHLLRTCGVVRVTTVDIHSAEGLALFAMPTYSVSAIPSLAQYVKKNLKLISPVVVSPDFGSSKRTEAFAALYGAQHMQFAKERDRTTGEVKVETGELQVEDRDVIIVDDMISTGGTIRAAAEKLRAARARKIVVTCVHALLLGEAYERLIDAGVDEIIGTNTVPSKVSKVDATEPLAAYLRTVSE
ncbi:MAG: ribose-phosphate pyrophosphokinase [Thaumarchaeota archaeon]|nr:ribose-phosphate pyrophosphokinase [Nitrososphaerota archaeon]